MIGDMINWNRRGATAWQHSLLLAAVLTLGACSSGGDGNGPDGSGQTTAPLQPSGNNDENDTTTGADTPTDSAADLSQAGTLVPRLSIDTDVADFVSELGRDRVLNQPEALALMVEIVENHGGDTPFNCRDLGAAFASCSVTNLHIKDADGALAGTDWRIYFHSLRRVLRVDSDHFDIHWVNGDLHYLSPAEGYVGLDSTVESLRLITEFSHLVHTDVMPRFWLVTNAADGGTSTTLIANTNTADNELAYVVPITDDNAKAFSTETIPVATSAIRYAANADTAARAAALSARDIQARIVPKPSSMTLAAGNLLIGSGISFDVGALSASSAAALRERQATFMATADATPVSMSIDNTLTAEAYTLDVTPAGIDIRGGDEAGLFYGAQSVLSLVQVGEGSIPAISIVDAPRFSHRGMHIDMARNFRSVATLRRLIDQMAAYKLNTLHLHLSDDEGWRLEIPSLPELTQIGARRAFQLDANGNVFEGNALMPQLGSGPQTNNAGTGFYSRNEFISLLEYAAARHIRVIPEFDMPAHARAAVVAMRARASRLGEPGSTDIRIDDPADTSRYLTVQHYDDGILNPCVPGAYNFIETLVRDVAAMYTAAGLELDVWHMGGDEAINIFNGAGFDASGVPADPAFRDDPWSRSPACETYIANTAGVNSINELQAHFVERVSDIVAAAGIPALYAYHDIYDERSSASLATPRAGATVWEILHTGTADSTAGYANRGFETVISAPDFLYFDFLQEVHPEERGLYWASRMTDTRKVFSFAPENLPQNAETSTTNTGDPWTGRGNASRPNFIGMQGQLWGETVRTPEQADYMMFPRLLALAERAWHRASWELDYASGTSYSANTNRVDDDSLAEDWAGFAAVLGHKELAKLDAAGVQYRIPVPGARINNGLLDVNTALPGLPLEISNGGGFTAYTPSMSANGVTRVRARSANGSRPGRSDDIN